MQNLKKALIPALAGGLIFLTLAVPAFAQLPPQQPIQVCPNQDPFKGLCELFQAPDIFARVVSTVISILLIIAVIVAVFFLIWGGIRWILSGGDKAGVESARNTIIAAIIGLVIALVAFFIIQIVGQIFKINILQLSIPTL